MNTTETKSRRKSCAACVGAKRKCGMERPKCKRCQKKAISCAYPDTLSSINNISIPELEFPWLDDLMRDPNLLPWSGELQPQLATTTTNLSTHAFPTPPLVSNTSDLSSGSGAIPDYLIPSSSDNDLKTETTLPRAETEAAVHRFKTWPEKWLKEGKAPFIHPRLYIVMPKPLQDAYAACAIYSTKTPQNAFVAFGVIEALAGSLLNSYSNSADFDLNQAGVHGTPLDLLAAVQSLLIFQFIRLFDGDIRQRALAEAAEPVLERWTEQLQALTVVERGYTAANAPSWRSWVFAESCRRTIVMSIFLLGVYSFVRNGFCTRGKQVSRLSFTASRRLWDVEGEAEWERVRDKEVAKGREWWIKEMDFEGLVREACLEDLEDFGWIMAVMYRGRDVMERWVVERGRGGDGGRLGVGEQGVSSKVVQEVDIGRSLYGIMNGGEVYPEEYFEEARAMF